ncbi:MAG: NAD+ synthase [Spirochaetia bacterium]|nr:NAD+ synthase [Spirochaetia bacterium]
MSEINNVLPLPPTNSKIALNIIIRTFKNEIEKTGLTRAVIGLSGGIDSALTLFLAARALGSQNVTAVFMPYKLTSPLSREHALLAANMCGIKLLEEDITKMADSYFNTASFGSDNDRLRKGNVLARLRMIVLYDYSVFTKSIVAGTSNKSEILLGYGTLWGDMASGVNPVGDLYKFQVYAISRHLGIPDDIVQKAPSADLWEGQTDEGELKMTYDFIDRILYYWIDLGWNKERIYTALHEAGQDPQTADMVFNRVMASQYKRKMPLIIKVSEKTIDREFRYPRDWGM